MKSIATNISKLNQSLINVTERDEAYFNSPFHHHPEIELVYIKEGFGKRIIGNTVEDFEEGEVLLIGSHTPHIWMSDKSFYLSGNTKRCKAIVLYFNPDIFSDSFYQMEDSFYLNQLLKRSKNGIKITGDARKDIINRLEKMPGIKNLDKLICLLYILNIISITNDMQLISKQEIIHPADSGRLNSLLEYINVNHNNKITLNEMAKISNLTPESFCRYFKQKTGKKFNDFLQRTRINFACQSLLNTDMTIAEIAYKNGFKTTPGFNKSFKKVKGSSPSEYRKKVSENLHDSFNLKHTLQTNVS